MGHRIPQQDHAQDGTARPARRRLGTTRAAKVLLAATSVLLLSSCSQSSDSQWQRWALPPGISTQTGGIFELWIGAWIAVGVIFFFVFGLIIYALVRYRRRSDSEVPVQLRYNLPIEVLYTIAPVVVVAVFFFHTVRVQNDVTAQTDNPDHVIQVVGYKWAWNFIYLDEDVVGGDDVYDVGTPEDYTDLYLPAGETVRFELYSPDVIHSFWIPEIYFKRDVVPGRDNTFDLTATTEGDFRGRCAEFCGISHSRMLFDVHVVSPEEYDQHLQDLQDAGAVGAPQGSQLVETVDGLEPAEEAAE